MRKSRTKKAIFKISRMLFEGSKTNAYERIHLTVLGKCRVNDVNVYRPLPNDK